MELNAASAVRCELRAGVATISLIANATGSLGSDCLRELHAAIDGLGRDSACRAIVLTSNESEFGAGFDLIELGAAVAASDMRPAQLFADCLLTISQARQPTIAVVDGKAAGGSVGLIAACNIVIGGARAAFQLPEVTIGMLPILIAPYLIRRISPARLRYLALSSRAIDVREAHLFGLVDEVSGDNIEECVARQIKRIMRSSPEALTECKRQLACSRDEANAAVAQLADWMRRPGVGEAIADFADGLAPAWFAEGKEHDGSG